MFFYYDLYYLWLLIPAMIIAMVAQAKVSSAFKKYSKVYSNKGITGSQAAREILDKNGLSHVAVERTTGKLSDHYDPRSNVIRLSDEVYSSSSVASIGVAAHEAGHALQYANSYTPIKIRTAILPVTQIGSMLAFPLAILGLVMSVKPLVIFGIILFMAVVLFQLVTLPVEFNASKRAMTIITESGMLDETEARGAKKVLSAAAMTYVAALIVAVLNLIRLLLIARRSD